MIMIMDGWMDVHIDDRGMLHVKLIIHMYYTELATSVPPSKFNIPF